MWKRASIAATAVRCGGVRGMQSRRIIRTWDRVQPSFWHLMASLEQSLMDAEVMSRRVFSPRFPPYAPLAPNLMPKLGVNDDDFFRDLPIDGPGNTMETTATTANQTRSKETVSTSSPASAEKEGTEAALAAEELSAGNTGAVPRPSYACYSYSYSTCLDKDGGRIGSARRRYEDSTGRLKAMHEREVDGRKLKTVWKRSDTQDEGDCKSLCSVGSPDEFEKLWEKTPFGRAEDEEQTKWMEARERSMYQAFGIEYKPLGEAEQASVPTEGSLEEEVKVRKEAIQRASKRQEEETTPPQYTS